MGHEKTVKKMLDKSNEKMIFKSFVKITLVKLKFPETTR